MSAVAVDTSVLLSIFKGEPRGALWLKTLESTADVASLIVSPVVVAEVRSFFSTDEDCRHALDELGLEHSALTEAACLLAGRIYRAYRREGGPRTTILPDFLVAAHAATVADSLATEDRGFLRAYFPSIRLLAPSAARD